MQWQIQDSDFSRERIPALGNRFLIGNGYMGIRGTLEEFRKEQLVAVNLAGIFDKVGDGWREPLNAPNGLYTVVEIDGEKYSLLEKEAESHKVSLDFRHGIFSRETSWLTPKGRVTVRSTRFASRWERHLCCMRYEVETEFDCEARIFTGIDGDVWDIHGPHYDTLQMEQKGDALWMQGTTHEKKDQVTVLEQLHTSAGCCEKIRKTEKMLGHELVTEIRSGVPWSFEKAVVVYTSQDKTDPSCQVCSWEENGIRILETAGEKGFAGELKFHCEKWEELWETAEVKIEGDEEAEISLNYSIYHLLSIAPAPGGSISIPARGLSGQTYKGAVFWDTEMFMLDFFLFTSPETARSLVKYRIDTLDGALKKASDYGWKGAFYAWESQEGGFDACTDYNVTDVFTGRPVRTYFRDKQVHISAAVVYGILRYVEMTGDDSVMAEGGLRTVVECARFYHSLLQKQVEKEEYEIHDVIGPDEYHERVNNNGYTNRMAKFVLEKAAGCLEKYPELAQKLPYDVAEKIEEFQDGAKKLKLPAQDENGVLEQFDGYFGLEDASLEEVRSRILNPKEYWGGANGVATHTKVIKQADVVTWLSLFPEDYPEEIQKKNWEYYEPRTEHGSSLSACMYALLACRCHMPDKAYPFFMKSAKADLTDGGKEWAGLVYIGGTHPAAAGGAYMNVVEGFGGLTFDEKGPKVRPSLPMGWKELEFTVCYRGAKYRICIRENFCQVTRLAAAK